MTHFWLREERKNIIFFITDNWLSDSFLVKIRKKKEGYKKEGKREKEKEGESMVECNGGKMKKSNLNKHILNSLSSIK